MIAFQEVFYPIFQDVVTPLERKQAWRKT